MPDFTLDVAAFRAWLAGRNPTELVGQANSPSACPAACWVYGQTGRLALVYRDVVRVEDVRRPTPAWLSAFMHAVDSLPRGPWWVSAGQALVILDGVIVLDEAEAGDVQ